MPPGVQTLETVWITLADGCRLAARVWLPVDAGPVPAILEYLPYRLNDTTAVGDSARFPYLAERGYACVRVDQRGSGESDGILHDEYEPQEQLDCCEVIAWIAEQPWCSGQVGMVGLSWSGFNGLQVAALRPPALKAIMTLCAADDRYADDVHYDGGCVGSDMLGWSASMLGWNARPPDPAIVGDRWREMWLERMEHVAPFTDLWLGHQRRDAYWKHGSVSEDYSAIECAVFAVGGWNDGYSNAIPRLLEQLPGPRKGLIGPWGHAWPQSAKIQPTIGFLQELARWFDYWLKGIDNGIMDEPMLRAWMEDPLPASPYYPSIPGRWVAERSWPPAGATERTLVLNPGSLDGDPGPEVDMHICGIQTAGWDAGQWCPYGDPGDWPGDQRAMDGMSLTFDSPPLPDRLETLGFPEVTLTVASDRPNALVIVRLCEVAPDGSSTLVTRALQNLTHRDSDEFPEPLEPGARYTVTVKLDARGHAFAKGSRVRLGISPTYWPWAWPSPQEATLTITTGASTLRLPERPPSPDDLELPEFEPPEYAPPFPIEQLEQGVNGRVITRDLVTGRQRLEYNWDTGGVFRLPNGLEHGDANTTVFEIVEGDPLSAEVRCRMSGSQARGAWKTRWETLHTMSCDATHFRVVASLTAHEGDACVFTKTWTSVIPRDLV